MTYKTAPFECGTVLLPSMTQGLIEAYETVNKDCTASIKAFVFVNNVFIYRCELKMDDATKMVTGTATLVCSGVTKNGTQYHPIMHLEIKESE